MAGLDVSVNENRFSLTLTHALGVAAAALLHWGEPGESSVFAYGVALATIGHARFLRVCFVQKIQRLVFLRVEHPRKNEPADA